MKEEQCFLFTCALCKGQTNEAHVAAALQDEVLIAETARRIGRKQTPHAGPGRPTLVRCPGCDIEMSAQELRDHRIPCVRERLNKLKYKKFQLYPKDPDPHPLFMLTGVTEDQADFEKITSGHTLTVELRKIAEIFAGQSEDANYIRVLGRVAWNHDRMLWTFMPSRLGRPPAAVR